MADRPQAVNAPSSAAVAIDVRHELVEDVFWCCSCGEVYLGAITRKEAQRSHRAHLRRVDAAWAAA